MSKPNYLDTFTKSLKKRSAEKPQGETSDKRPEVSMPPKERLWPVEGKEVDGPTLRCFGHACEYVSYKDTMGRLVLWCSKVNEKVYDIEDCPFEYWFKDKNGWPIKKGSKP